MVEWNDGLEWWNGIVEWNSGMVEWNNGMANVANYNCIEYLCVMVVLCGQTAFSSAWCSSIRDDKRLLGRIQCLFELRPTKLHVT